MNAAKRRDRLADAATWDGYRSARVNPRTGTLVVVVDAYEQGIESPEVGGLRWATICEDHDTVVTHETRALATAHAAEPGGWCQQCHAIEATP